MKKIYYIISGLCILLSSCGEEEAALCVDPAQRIYLRAAVENGITISRTPFSETAPNERNPLEVAVWASTVPNVFEDQNKNGSAANNYEVALHTRAYFSNGEEQLLDQAVYPKPQTDTEAAMPVYFVGMHPEGGWNGTTGTSAVKTFNGSEDVMFAYQIEGKYAENVDKWPKFIFKHLLTWLTVTVTAESEPVRDAWGRLKSLKVESSVGNTVTIDFTKCRKPNVDPAADPTFSADSITFSPGAESLSAGVVSLDFYETGTDNVFVNKDDEKTWYTIPYNETEEVAYVLCPPVTASADYDGDKTYEYTLIVETERRTVEVPVDLMAKKEDNTLTHFAGSTMNYHFTLNLNFRMSNNIMLTSSVEDWNPGGISNGIISPE